MQVLRFRSFAFLSLMSFASVSLADEPPVFVAKLPDSIPLNAVEPTHRRTTTNPLDEYRESMRLKYANPHSRNSKLPAMSTSVRTPPVVTHRNFTQISPDVVSASYAEPIRTNFQSHSRPTYVAPNQVSSPTVGLETNYSNGSDSCSNSCASMQTQPLPTFDPGPSGFPYYFRPYQYSDIAKHQNETFVQDRKNPYDNRFFESIYSR